MSKCRRRVSNLVVTGAIVAPQVFFNSDESEFEQVVSLSYMCNHLSCFEQDAHARMNVSWALDGTSRAAGLWGVSRSACNKVSSLCNAAGSLSFAGRVFLNVHEQKYDRFRGCEVSIKLIGTNKSVCYDFLCLILKLILLITTTEKSFLCNQSIYLT